MKITEEYTSPEKINYILEYQDCNDFSVLEYSKCRQCYGVCFTGNSTIIIGFGGKKNAWGLIGGTIENYETFEETLIREVKEESNMEILSSCPIGYQKVIDTRDNSYIFQLRYACIVRPYGTFLSDPAGTVTEIKEIQIINYKEYFYWGKIGQRILERAEEIYPKLVSHETNNNIHYNNA